MQGFIYGPQILFSGAELIAGTAMAGLMTRAALVSAGFSIVLMLMFG